MSDHLNVTERSNLMSRIRSADTAPERSVRSALHSNGFRYRLHYSKLPGKPDVVLPRYRFAVFVNGCFWHQHGCSRSFQPRSNQSYWHAKLIRNRARDLETLTHLELLGWTSRIIWECDLVQGTQALLHELAQCRSHLYWASARTVSKPRKASQTRAPHS